jgi:hypothetical protein
MGLPLDRHSGAGKVARRAARIDPRGGARV